MSIFTHNTSGVVRIYTIPDAGTPTLRRWRWEDLDPFTQGYIEAMGVGTFSDLAPETLAAILKDCERFQKYSGKPRTHLYGGIMWKQRGFGMLPQYPPLTPYLGDDGKVYLREAS